MNRLNQAMNRLNYSNTDSIIDCYMFSLHVFEFTILNLIEQICALYKRLGFVSLANIAFPLDHYDIFKYLK